MAQMEGQTIKARLGAVRLLEITMTDWNQSISHLYVSDFLGISLLKAHVFLNGDCQPWTHIAPAELHHQDLVVSPMRRCCFVQGDVFMVTGIIHV